MGFIEVVETVGTVLDGTGVAIIANRGISLAAFREIYFLLILGGLGTALVACALTTERGRGANRERR